jgi:transposase
MSKAQLVITAVVLEGRSKSEVARDYDVSGFWVQQLVRRYETEGAAAFGPHSRRPHRNPRAVDTAVEDTIVRLRKTLDKQGYDAGTATIAEHLTRDPGVANVPAVSTIWRTLSRRGFVTPQPQKRPRSAWKRFQAELPNQCWQADVAHWRLADHTEVEILDLLPPRHRQPRPPHHDRPRRCGHLHRGLRPMGPTGGRAHRQRCHHRQTTRPRPHRAGNHPG